MFNNQQPILLGQTENKQFFSSNSVTSVNSKQPPFTPFALIQTK